MSVQFGRWSFDGVPASPEYLARVREILVPYGPDGEASYSRSGVDLLYCSLHTTKESRVEIQPHVFESGTVLLWDGRLDNRNEVIALLRGTVSTDSTDISIVAAAYERWSTQSFARLTGDWALSIWSPLDNALVLAKDPIGLRHLYYTLDKDCVTWCTVLDPLVRLAERGLEPDEEYLAGWLSLFPAAHLTPYVGIHSVPPSSYVRLAHGTSATYEYWGFDPEKRIRYRSDGEYEEQFRVVFAQSVRRRLRSDAPILAELSGGMDSSSIVCTADRVAASQGDEVPRVDTISYYDDSEPNWNERPYFSLVEKMRERPGHHINANSQTLFDFIGASFSTTPASHLRSSELGRQFASYTGSRGYRVVLSGIGGDEVTGGVPNPAPELMDLLAARDFRALARQLKIWALEKRKPWFHLFSDAAWQFFPISLAGMPRDTNPAPWFLPAFSERHRNALAGYPSRIRYRGPLPSFQVALATLRAMQRQLSSEALPKDPVYEVRYPYLDRNLLEFLFAVPREQLVRPGRRRSLMRRSLVGIVPSEILNRRRKAYVARSTRAAISREWDSFIAVSQHMVTASMGIVDANAFRTALDNARCGGNAPVVTLMRTVWLEFWLAGLKSREILREGSQRTALHSGLPHKSAAPARTPA